MKLPIIFSLISIIVALIGTGWSGYRLLARVLDDAPFTAGQIVTPMCLCYLLAIVVWGMVWLTFTRSDR